MNREIYRTISLVFRAFWKPILLTILLNSIQIFVGNYTNVAFQRLLDGLPSTRSIAPLVPLLAWYIGSWILNHILIYLEGIPSTPLNIGVTQWVKLQALQKIARIDFQAYQNLGTGNLIQVIENGAQAVQRILTGFFISNLVGIAQFLIGLYFIRIYDQTLFFFILGGYGIFYLVTYYLMRFLRAELEKLLANQEDFSKFSVRAFMEMVVFRVNNRFKSEYERIKTISDEVVRSRIKVYLLQELSYTGFAFVIFLVEAVVVIEQAGKIIAGTSTIGTMVALVAFVRLVFWPIIGFGQSWMQYKLDAITFAHFYRFESLPDDPGLQGKKVCVFQKGEIRFQRVNFAFAEQEVLRDFSLLLEGNKTTALVGASGGGKSTLVRLLLHLLKPQSGQVWVDGQNLDEVNLSSYYQAVAYIPQEPPIFDGSIRENLTFNQPVTAERLDEIAGLVGLKDLIQKLPRGFDTVVGERGLKLSGGERQRLAFARVLLQDPKIIILDEPTSALDSITEDFITRNMLPFFKGKTVILVAHRLQTVKDADRIIVLEAGQIIQQGTFDMLVATEGRFRQLWQKQAHERDTDSAIAG
jgi:ATP-binding cassette, subfamily B, bacterial